MKLRGTVRRSDLEGGLWIFEATDGAVYQLRGGGVDLLVDGVAATIEGTVDRGGFSIGMCGDVFVVSSYSVQQ